MAKGTGNWDWNEIPVNYSVLMVPIKAFSSESDLEQNIAYMQNYNFAHFAPNIPETDIPMPSKASQEQIDEMEAASGRKAMISFRSNSIPRTHILITNFDQNTKTFGEALREDLLHVEQEINNHQAQGSDYSVLKDARDSKELLLEIAEIVKAGNAAQPEKYFLDNLQQCAPDFKQAVINPAGMAIVSKGVSFITATMKNGL